MNHLKGKVAIVTGGSRGVGKGIALGLAEYGATVYITGRTEVGSHLPEFLRHTNIYETAKEASTLGGIGIPGRCDHADDKETENLFKRVYEEQGRLDILVNNAWGGSSHVMQPYYFNTPFWEQPVSLWEDHYTVGLRSNYIASRLAAQMMTRQKNGLIVNISFFGGRRYWNNVAYGVCKAAVDKMSADTAYELKDYGVSVFSLYPGNVRSEGMAELAKYDKNIDIEKMESPRFIGRCIAALALDEKSLEDTGKILIAAEIAERYGITDINGYQPKSLRNELW